MGDHIDLLPCPFCGCTAELVQLGTGRQACIVSCTDCGATLSSSETFSSGAAWNRRFHNAILRAAIQAAADAAGVVLAEAWESEAVLRDGVRAHGWWWKRDDDDGTLTLYRPDDLWPVLHVQAAYRWGYRSWMNVRSEDDDDNISPTEAEACEAACEALGVPCPPIPEVTS